MVVSFWPQKEDEHIQGMRFNKHLSSTGLRLSQRRRHSKVRYPSISNFNSQRTKIFTVPTMEIISGNRNNRIRKAYRCITLCTISIRLQCSLEFDSRVGRGLVFYKSDVNKERYYISISSKFGIESPCSKYDTRDKIQRHFCVFTVANNSLSLEWSLLWSAKDWDQHKDNREHWR